MAQTTAFVGNERKGGADMQRKWLQDTHRNEYAGFLALAWSLIRRVSFSLPS